MNNIKNNNRVSISKWKKYKTTVVLLRKKLERKVYSHRSLI